MIEISCALCGKKDYDVIFPESFSLKKINKSTFSARRIPERIHYRIVRCRICGQIFSSPILSELELAILYRDSVFTYDDQEEDLKKTYGHYLNKAVTGLPEKENFLDIGCGNGFMLQVARKSGFKNVFGVEPSKDSIAKSSKDIRNSIKKEMFRTGLYPDNFFDLVTVFQTLDHIPDPNLFLKNIFTILRPGGRVLAYNHDVSAYSVRILGEKSPIFDIEHIYLFDKTTMRKIFENNGFKIDWVGSTFNIYPIRYWLRMLPLPVLLKQVLIKVASFLKFENFRPKIYAGNLGLIASK